MLIRRLSQSVLVTMTSCLSKHIFSGVFVVFPYYIMGYPKLKDIRLLSCFYSLLIVYVKTDCRIRIVIEMNTWRTSLVPVY